MGLMCASHSTASFPIPQQVQKSSLGSVVGILGSVVGILGSAVDRAAQPCVTAGKTANRKCTYKDASWLQSPFLSLISRSTEGKITAGLCILNIKQDFLKASKYLLNIILLLNETGPEKF